MIELPDGVHPNGASPALVDFGGVQKGATGGAALRVDRNGNRFRVAMTLPIGRGLSAQRIVSRLIQGKTKGLKVEYPLQGVDQGYPGAPVVDGAGQAGDTIHLRGLTPHYVAEEGFWLTIYDATDQGYLHQVGAQSFAGADGKIILSIQPNLRVPFADGTRVELACPTIEGLVEGDEMSWSLALGGLVDSLAFTIEEAA
ncbi:MAG: hypothetical protein DI607_05750 [Sphingomonas hengshuiensis]|nr:MAG: hypothetical protein DI607_05750 [Sphingomonas hengshuiensis]